MEISSKYERLLKMTDEIDRDLKEVDGNKDILDTVSVKIQSFWNKVKDEENTPEIARLRIQAKFYMKRIKEIAEIYAVKRSTIEEEMRRGRLRTNKISEVDGDSPEDNEFYSIQSSRVDHIISSAMDSIGSLNRQGNIIDSINQKLKLGVRRLGLSSEFIKNMENRFKKDNIIFIILFALTIILIIFFAISLR